jgi:hypothetical protein
MYFNIYCSIYHSTPIFKLQSRENTEFKLVSMHKIPVDTCKIPDEDDGGWSSTVGPSAWAAVRFPVAARQSRRSTGGRIDWRTGQRRRASAPAEDGAAPLLGQ